MPGGRGPMWGYNPLKDPILLFLLIVCSFVTCVMFGRLDDVFQLLKWFFPW